MMERWRVTDSSLVIDRPTLIVYLKKVYITCFTQCSVALLQSPAIAIAIAKTVIFWSCYF